MICDAHKEKLIDLIKRESYSLEQLRKMNMLNGDKKLIFVDQLLKLIKE